MDFDRNSWVVAMKPPDWKVQFWNAHNKLFFVGDPGDWRPSVGVSTALFRPSDVSSLRVVSSRIEEFHGLTARKYQLATSAADGVAVNHAWQALLVTNAEYWVLDDKTIPKSATTILQRTYGLPVVAGIPLALQAKIKKGADRRELTFISKSNKPALVADFTVPAGYKRVKQQQDVVNDEDANAGLADFIR